MPENVIPIRLEFDTLYYFKMEAEDDDSNFLGEINCR
jgi:hypothetical protein